MAIYRDIYDGPPRWYTETRTRKRYIMIHATANDASAEAEASFAKRRDSRVSSHYYVDDDSIVQSLDTDFRAWHAGNTEGNDHAIAYELTARNMSVGRAWWVDLANIEWPLMVAAIARDCREFGITPRDLTVAELRAGQLTGFCMHFEGNDAWGGSDHTDPGPNFPMGHLVRQVRAALDGEDDMDQNDIVKHTDKNVAFHLRNTLRGVDQNTDQLAEIRATVRTLAGEDQAEVVRAELDRHRAVLLDRLPSELGPALLAELGPALVATLGDAAAELPAEVVEAAVGRALARTSLTVAPAAGGGGEPV